MDTEDAAKPGSTLTPAEDVAKAERLATYRQWLVVAEQKSQDDYDKAVVALSGGALGISFAFVKDLVGPGGVAGPGWLVAAWLLWALSIISVLASYYVSRLALRSAIVDCDTGDIYKCKTPGGIHTQLLRGLNVASGSAFVLGVFCITLFVYFNSPKERRDDAKATKQTAHQATAADSAKGARQTGKVTSEADAVQHAGPRLRAAPVQVDVDREGLGAAAAAQALSIGQLVAEEKPHKDAGAGEPKQ